MNKLLWILVAMSGQIVFGVGSQGMHLTPLRESGEVNFTDVKAVHFKIDELPQFSFLVANEQLKRLHSSEEHQVVAAWLQLRLLQEKKYVFDQLERSDLWQTRGKRVERLIDLLELASIYEKSVPEIYATCFQKTRSSDRYVPGCGNMPRALMRPELLKRRSGLIS